MIGRKNYLYKNGLDGIDGFIYFKILEGFLQIVVLLESYIRVMDEFGMDIINVNLYVFVNELRKEYNFVKYK